MSATTLAQVTFLLTESFVRAGIYASPEQALKHIILDYIERQIAWVEAVYNALLRLLPASPVMHNPRSTDLKIYGWDAFRVKIRATVTPTLTFQVWLDHNPRTSAMFTSCSATAVRCSVWTMPCTTRILE